MKRRKECQEKGSPYQELRIKLCKSQSEHSSMLAKQVDLSLKTRNKLRIKRKIPETEKVRMLDVMCITQMSIRRRRRRIFYCLLLLSMCLCVLQPLGGCGRFVVAQEDETASVNQLDQLNENPQPLTTTSSFDRLANSEADRANEVDYILTEPTNLPESDDAQSDTSASAQADEISTTSTTTETSTSSNLPSSSTNPSSSISLDEASETQSSSQLVRNRKSPDNRISSNTTTLSQEQASSTSSLSDSTIDKSTNQNQQEQAKQQQHSTLSSLDYDEFDLDYQLKLNTSGISDTPSSSTSPRPPSWSALIRTSNVFTPTPAGPLNSNLSTQIVESSASSGYQQSPSTPPMIPALLTVKSTQLSKQELERVRPQFLLYQDNYDINGSADQSMAFNNGDLLATASGFPTASLSIALNNSSLTPQQLLLMSNRGDQVGLNFSSSSFNPSVGLLARPTVENLLALRAGGLSAQQRLQMFLNESSSEPIASATSSPVSVLNDDDSSVVSPTVSSLLTQTTTTTTSLATNNSSSAKKVGPSQANQWHNYPHPNLHQNPLLLHHILNKPSLYAQHVGANQQHQQQSSPQQSFSQVEPTHVTPTQSPLPTVLVTPTSVTNSEIPSASASTHPTPSLRTEPARIAAHVTGWPADYLAQLLAASRVSNRHTGTQAEASRSTSSTGQLPFGFTRLRQTAPSEVRQPSGNQLVAAPSLLQEIYTPRPHGMPYPQQQQSLPRDPHELLRRLRLAQQAAVISNSNQSQQPGRRQTTAVGVNQSQAGNNLSEEDMSTYVSQLAALGEQQSTTPGSGSHNNSALNELEALIQRLLTAEQFEQVAAQTPASRIIGASNWHLKKPALHLATQSRQSMQEQDSNMRIKAAQQRHKQLLDILKLSKNGGGSLDGGAGSGGNSSYALDEILHTQASADSNVTSSNVGHHQDHVPASNSVQQNILSDGFDEQLSNKPIPEWLERQIIQETLGPHQAATRAALLHSLPRPHFHPIGPGSPVMPIVARRPTFIVPLNAHTPQPLHPLLGIRPTHFRTASASQLQGVILAGPHHHTMNTPSGSLLRLTAAHPAAQLQALITSSTARHPVAQAIGLKRPTSASATIQTADSQQNLIERFPFASAPAYLIKLPTLTGGTITASGSFGAPGVRFLRPRPIVPLRFLGVPSRLRLVATSGGNSQVTSSPGLQAAPSMHHLQTSFQSPHDLHLRGHQHHLHSHGYQHQLAAQAAMDSVALQPPGATFIGRIPTQFQQPVNAIIEPQAGTVHALPGSPELASQQAKLQLFYPLNSNTIQNSSSSLQQQQLLQVAAHSPALRTQLAQQASANELQQQPAMQQQSSFSSGQQQVVGSASTGAALNRLQQATASLVELTSLASLVDEMVGSDIDPSPALALVQAINSLQQQHQQQHLNTQASSTSTSATQPHSMDTNSQLQISAAPFTLRGLLNAGLWRDKQLNKVRDFKTLERLVGAANAAKFKPQARLRVKYIRVPIAVYETSNSSSLDAVDEDANVRSLINKNQLAELVAADANREKTGVSNGSQGSSGLQPDQNSQNSVPASSNNDYLFDELSSDSVPHLALALRDLQQQQEGASSDSDHPTYLPSANLKPAFRPATGGALNSNQQLELYYSMLQAAASNAIPSKNNKLAIVGEKKRRNKKGKKLEQDEQDSESDEDEERDHEDHLAQSDLPMLESLISTIFHGSPSSVTQQQSNLALNSLYNSNPAAFNSYVQGFTAAAAAGNTIPNWTSRGRGLHTETSSQLESYLQPQSYSLNPFNRHRFSLGEVVGALGARKIISSLLGKGRRARTNKRAVTQNSRAHRFLKPTPVPPMQYSTTTIRSTLTLPSKDLTSKQASQSVTVRPRPNSVYYINNEPSVNKKTKETIKKALKPSAQSTSSNLANQPVPVIQPRGPKGTHPASFSSNSNNNGNNILRTLYNPVTNQIETTTITAQQSIIDSLNNSTIGYQMVTGATVTQPNTIKVNLFKPSAGHGGQPVQLKFYLTDKSSNHHHPEMNTNTTTFPTSPTTTLTSSKIRRRKDIMAMPLYHVVADHYSKLYS